MKINKLQKLFLEILSIFIGITLSFLFEDYRSERNETQARKEIIQSLINDIESRTNSLYSDVEFSSISINSIDSALLLSQLDIQLSNKQIENFIYSIGNDHSVANETSPSFISLLSSSSWQQLPDSIRVEIFDLYYIEYGLLKRVYDKFVDYSSFTKTHYFPLLHVDLYNQKTSTWNLESRNGNEAYLNVNKSLKNREFRSMLIILRNQYNKSIRYQKSSIEVGIRLAQNLKIYLQNQ